MPFQIPNLADAAFSAQASPFSTDIAILQAGVKGDGVVSGCAVTAQGSPDMTLAVAAGRIRIAAVDALVTAGNVTITAANGTNPRIDLVVVNGSGTKSVTAGTAAAAPVPPAVPATSIVLAMVYVPANDTAIASNQITDKRCDVFTLLATPPVGRLFVGGDSRSVPVVQVGGAMFVATGARRGWNEIVREAFGIPSPIQTFDLPHTAVTVAAGTSVGISLADDNMLAWVSIIPNGSVAANASNYRTYTIAHFPVTYAVRDTRAADLNGLAGAVEKVLYDIRDVLTLTNRNTLPGNSVLWMATHIATVAEAITGSVAGPGGQIRTWIMDRYWNLAVSGAQLHPGHAANKAMTGSWSDWLAWQPKPRVPAPVVRATAAASTSATTITTTALVEALASGDTIMFQGGTEVTISATEAVGQTTLSVNAIPGNIAIDEVGAYSGGVGGWRQPLLPHIGLVCMHHGINDASNNTFASRGTVWKETVRAVIAISCCPHRVYVQPNDNSTDDISIVRTNGSGGTSAWASVAPADPWTARLRYLQLTGTIGGTKPTLDFKIPPWHKAGQAIDLFFPTKAGSGNGYSATLTYGAAAAAPSALDFAGGVRVNNAQSAEVDTGVASDLGPGGQGGIVCKRITGLPAGGGTVRITVDTRGSGGAAAVFNVDLMGIECEPGRGVPFLWMSLPYQPNKDVGASGRTADAVLDQWNGAALDVVNERVEEPRNVYYLDLNAALGNADPDYFYTEGSHYNDLGNLRIADTVVNKAVTTFSREQLMAR